MSKTVSLSAIKIVTTLPTQSKVVAASQNVAASSVGGAAASGQATTVTKM